MGVEPARIDVLQSIPGVTFDDAWRDAVSGHLGGVPVRYISREHLIQNKLAAGRPQDLGDVDLLRKYKPKG